MKHVANKLLLHPADEGCVAILSSNFSNYKSKRQEKKKENIFEMRKKCTAYSYFYAYMQKKYY
jgi:hypothetical protein